jgi:hypothetical protein
MKRKFEKYQSVVLEQDLVKSVRVGLVEGSFLAKGARGIVVDHLIHDGIAVEFFNDEGRTVEVASIPESYVRAASNTEMEDVQRHKARSA